ncbi:hypothetical protein [Myxococcus phage Mx4 ts27htf-1hrm-1]|nr:hypothetical protein Mx4_p36 [Myxococcus phage Mx4]WNM70376.1 hypothetical protein [Myxococcus phage Mx4 ts27htf-1hrm-1]
MTALAAGVALATFAATLVLVYLRLRWWARRHAEAEKLLAETGEWARGLGERLRESELVRAKAELALLYLWPTVRVETLERRAAAAALLSLFPRLEATGGLTRRDVTCPKCSDADCLAPGRCDDPEYFFGGIGP